MHPKYILLALFHLGSAQILPELPRRFRRGPTIPTEYDNLPSSPTISADTYAASGKTKPARETGRNMSCSTMAAGKTRSSISNGSASNTVEKNIEDYYQPLYNEMAISTQIATPECIENCPMPPEVQHKFEVLFYGSRKVNVVGQNEFNHNDDLDNISEYSGTIEYSTVEEGGSVGIYYLGCSTAVCLIHLNRLKVTGFDLKQVSLKKFLPPWDLEETATVELLQRCWVNITASSKDENGSPRWNNFSDEVCDLTDSKSMEQINNSNVSQIADHACQEIFSYNLIATFHEMCENAVDDKLEMNDSSWEKYDLNEASHAAIEKLQWYKDIESELKAHYNQHQADDGTESPFDISGNRPHQPKTSEHHRHWPKKHAAM